MEKRWFEFFICEFMINWKRLPRKGINRALAPNLSVASQRCLVVKRTWSFYASGAASSAAGASSAGASSAAGASAAAAS